MKLSLSVTAKLGLLILSVLAVAFAVVYLAFERDNAGDLDFLMRKEARILCQQIVMTREWVARHGGIYVLQGRGEGTNPYLYQVGPGKIIAEIRTADGRTLSMVTPAMMTRELSEMSIRRDGLRYRLTSLHALNPANAPDAFEILALRKLDEGAAEVGEIVREEGRAIFRYLSALPVKEICLRCHGAQGYKVGEVRGAISLSLPMDTELHMTSMKGQAALAGGILLVSLVLISLVIGSRMLIVRPIREISAFAAAMGHGGVLSVPLLHRGDETGELARSLQAAAEEMCAYRQGLENLVETRTRELSESNRTLNEVIRQKELILATASEGIVGLDEEGRIVFVNPATESLLGWGREEMLGRDHHAVMYHSSSGSESRSSKNCPFFSKAYRNDLPPVEENFRRRDGSAFPVEISCAPILKEDRFVGAVMTFRDIAERKEAERKIQQLAYFDSLTGLPNRALFNDRLNQGLALARRARNLLAVLFLDLDDFKKVNDTLGHAAGDHYLRIIARRLRECLRASDSVCRLGGDEFVCLAAIGKPEEAALIAGIILKNIAHPISLEGHRLATSCSIGIALFPIDGLEGDDLLNRADAAMYEAKRSGKNSFRFATANDPKD